MKRWKTGVALMVSCLALASCAENSKKDEVTPQTDPNFCLTNPNDPSCKGDICKTNPNDPSCKSDICKTNPNDPSCQSDICKTNPNDPSCVTTGTPSISDFDLKSGLPGATMTITGKNLQTTSVVCFGSESKCVTPSSKTNTTVAVTVPDGGFGMVNVYLKVNGKALSVGLFTFLTQQQCAENDPSCTPPNKDEIDWCQTTHVAAKLKSGEKLDAYAQVFEPEKTGASGNHAAIFAEVGYADEMERDLAKFTWKPATRNESFNGAAANTNDEYMAKDIALQDGSYKVAFRFSLDGTNWKVCGKNGPTESAADMPTVDIAPEVIPEPVVDWCMIMNDKDLISSRKGFDSDAIYARVHAENCTTDAGPCEKLMAQVGYGPIPLANSDTLGKAFTWKDAELNDAYVDDPDEDRVEYMANLKETNEGQYAVAYRFSVDAGKSWFYCDKSDDGVFSANDTLKWDVTENGEPWDMQPGTTVEWCSIKGPASLSVRANRETEKVFAQAYVKNCTGYPYEKCKNLKAQVGYGDSSAADASEFTFVDATLNENLYPHSNNSEFMASLKPTEAGDYAVAYRFSLDDGANWTYCDTDNDMRFEMAKTVPLHVDKDEDVIRWCRVQHPQTQTVKVGEESAKIYGRVYVPNCSEGTAKCASVTAELGYGLKGTDKESFHYVQADYNSEFTTTDNDEYSAKITINEPGGYDIIYRFSTNGGQTWTYCDFDDADGFQIEKAASMIVKDDTLEVSWCRITNMDDTMDVTAGGVSQGIEAQARVDGCTDGDKRCSNLTAYVGYGNRNQEMGSFKFFDAQFDKNVGDNDQFVGTITVPKTPGNYDVVYAFSLDGGKTKVYCDTDSDGNSFDQGKLGRITVSEPPAPKELHVDWCKLQYPNQDFTMLANGNTDVYGRVYVEGCTNVADGCQGKLMAEAGYGTGSDPAQYTYSHASFNLHDGPNEEYAATLFHVPAGTYSIAYRFSVDEGKTWTYCDLDGAGTGNNGGYDSNNTAHMTVTEPPKDEIGWCRTVLPDDASSITIKSGATASVYGEAYVKDCTEAAGDCKKLHSYVAYGEGATIDSEHYDIKEKTDATFDRQVSQNDRFASSVSVENNEETDKEYNLLYGFKLEGDSAITWCGLDGKVNDTVSNTAKLTVKSGIKHVDWCQMFIGDNANGNALELNDNEEHTFYAQAYVPDCTGNADACNGLTGFVAYSDNPSETNPDNFTKVNATYDSRVGYNDQFKAKIQIDNDNSSDKKYRVVFGFEYTDKNGTPQKRYCDLNNDSLFEMDKAVDLTVKKTIPWCEMNFDKGVTSYSVKPNDDNAFWARAYAYNCTDKDGKCSNIHAIVRDGVNGSEISGATIEYSQKVGNNDEYVGHAKFAGVGTHNIAVGFYAGNDTNHVTWCNMLNTDGQVGKVVVNDDDPINGGDPGITSYSPVSGKVGSQIVIEGRNLSLTSKVCFGETCVTPRSEDVSADSVKVTVPDGSGSSLVTIIVDNKRLTVGMFTYLEEAKPNEVDWCQTVYAKSPIVIGDPIDAYAQVYEPGVTGKDGSHNLKVEIGIADESETDPARISWFNEDTTTLNEGFVSDSNDEYMAKSVDFPIGSWLFAFRFSIDDGKTWTMCDSDGSQNGFSMDKMHRIDVTSVPKKSVDWCRIVNGTTSYTNEVGQDIAEDIYAQAHVANCGTNIQGKKTCSDLKAQIGYGPAQFANLDSIAKNFTWVDAKRNAGYDGSGGNDHDEFMGKVNTDTAGSYAIAYRFSVDDGRNWVYCDTTDDAYFSGTDTIAWDVVSSEQEEPENPIEWCRVTSPEKLTVRATRSTGPIRGQLYIKGCTGVPYNDSCMINGKSQPIQARIVYGNTDDVTGFTHVVSKDTIVEGPDEYFMINKSLPSSANTEFMASFKPTTNDVGSYDLYYQFRVGNNGQWVTCDYDDAPGYDKSKAVKLTILPDEDVIGFCRVQHPETQNIEQGASSDYYYGQVYVEGCTEGEVGDGGRCGSIRAQLGYAAKDDTKPVDEFTYVEAEHNPTFKGANDEYQAKLEGLKAGGYDVVYRFSTNGGTSWEYCDYDNEIGFTRAKAASLYVTKPAQRVSWCQLVGPTSVTATEGAMTEPIEGHAYVEDCTKGAQCTNLTAYVGYGTGTDVKDYTFTQVDYTGIVDNNNAFKGAFKAPKDVGEYNIVYAFSLDGGASKVYCDTADSSSFDPSKLGKLTVQQAPKPEEQKVDWCQIWWPEKDISIPTNESADVYGRVLVGGCTDVAGGCSGKLHAQLGYGSKDATDASDFTFVDATVTTSGTDLGRNEEYVATLSGLAKGEYALAYRFSLDGQNWTYCDRDNYTAGYDKTNTLHLNVTEIPKDTIGWCQMRALQSSDGVSLTIPSGSPTSFEGEVYVDKCTGNDYGPCEAVKGYLAYGTGENFDSYTKIEASLSDQQFYYNNDVYSASLTLTNDDDEDKVYNLVYGFKHNNDSNITWCKLKDDKLATLKVKSSKQKIEWCSLYFDRATDVLTIHSGEPTTIYGQAYVPGCTGKEGAACANLTAKVYYSENEFSESSNQSISANYDIKVGNNDQFKATFQQNPNEDKHYVMKYGFQLGNGPITWCGLNGSSNPADVVVTSTKVNWCRMYIDNDFDPSFASDAERGENDKTGRIRTQAYVEGCTGKSEPCDKLIPVLAYGAEDLDSISKFKQHNAGFRFSKPQDAPNNDEYVIDPILHNETGNTELYKLAVGFRTLNVGNDCAGDVDCSSGTCNLSTHKCNTLSDVTWCDLDGTDNNGSNDQNVPPFTLDQAIDISLASTDIVKTWGTDYTCGIDMDNSNGVIKGDIYVNGCTQDNVCADVKNPTLYYSTVAPTDINQITGWSKVDGSPLAKQGDSNNRSTASLPATAGKYHYVYSFEIEGAGGKTQKTFCYPEWKKPGERTVNSYGYYDVK